MTNPLVTVFSASARPGLALVRQLKRTACRIRAVTRQSDLHPDLQGVEVMPPDLNEPRSLERACAGADFVLFTSPAFTEQANKVLHGRRVGRAAKAANVRRLVYNTTTWYPERPIGVPRMDEKFHIASALRETGVPLTIVRPSLFMDNLLTKWLKPWIVGRNEFLYPHHTDLQVSWICLDDVVRFMIEAMKREELLGETLDVGGPEALRPGDAAALLSEALGRPIAYREITPREFGERMYEIFKNVTGLDREVYVSNLESHYRFKNETNPFLVPMDTVLKRNSDQADPHARMAQAAGLVAGPRGKGRLRVRLDLAAGASSGPARWCGALPI